MPSSAASAEELRTDVYGSLQPLADRLTAVLGSIIRHRYPSAVSFLEFQVFAESEHFLTSGFPVRAFFLDAQNTEHFERRAGKAVYPCPVDPGLLDLAGVVSEGTWQAWERRYDAVVWDWWTVVAEAVVEWVYSCWVRAGGREFRLAAYASIHDDEYALDLRTGKWLDVSTGEAVTGSRPNRSRT